MWARLCAELAELALPRRCAGCDRAGAALCGDCARAEPVLVERDRLLVRAAAPYAGGLRRALIAYKERGRRELARPLAGVLAVPIGASMQLIGPDVVLVPVPSSRAARRERGHDHVRALASLAGRRARLPVGRPLTLARSVRDSAGLDAAGRARNLGGAMRADPPGRAGASALLVDDITTTGVTLVEAARALRAAGWRVEGAVVVAATPLSSSRERLARAGDGSNVGSTKPENGVGDARPPSRPRGRPRTGGGRV